MSVCRIPLDARGDNDNEFAVQSSSKSWMAQGPEVEAGFYTVALGNSQVAGGSEAPALSF